MINYKIFLIRFFTFIGGLYFFLKFVLPEDNGLIAFKSIHEYVINGFTVVGSLAVGLGILNLVLVHGSRLAYKKLNWFFSAVLLTGLVTMLCVQGMDWYGKNQNAQKASGLLMLAEFSQRIVSDSASQTSGVLPRIERENLLRSSLSQQLQQISKIDAENNELRDSAVKTQNIVTGSTGLSDETHKAFQSQVVALSNLYRDELDRRYAAGQISNFASFLNQALFVSLGSAMFSLLGFYIAAAAYRAFRIRSVEATLMMLSALIVMLGQIPFGVWISSELPQMRMWLLQVPSSGAARAIEMGAAIAGLVLAIRMWLSLESESFKS